MPEKNQADIRIGCCGFAESRGAYFQEFRLVEVQQTFYQPPETKTLARWREEAPEGFEFALKAWQLITHAPTSPTYRRLKTPLSNEERAQAGNFQLTPVVRRAWERTLEAARALQATAVVFQCPASFRPEQENVDNLRRFFSSAERDGLIFCWEPRGNWPKELVRELCAELDLVHCVDPFKDEPLYGLVRYFRLHGIGGYRYRYSDEELGRLLQWCKPDKTNYVLFNNTNMLEDARRFAELVNHGR